MPIIRWTLAAALLAVVAGCGEAPAPVAEVPAEAEGQAEEPTYPADQKTYTEGLTPVETVVVPGYDGRAVAVDAGQLIRITDVEGHQVGDLFALERGDPSMHLCTFRSRTGNRKLFPAVGEGFVTLERQPILTFLSDHSPGVHDMLYATCDHNTYKRQGLENHPNCNRNFLDAVAEAGIEGYKWAPGPVNIFQNSTVAPDGKTIVTARTLSKAGDFLEFRAEQDIWLVLTACSYDLGDFIDGKSKPLKIEVFDAPSPEPAD
ncbi:MAG: DUF1989 domain-containing protein [Acidobacteria bacterium]|nr:DUF1989 domain-containing protein [Acidobacteriota bacterium]